MDEDTKAGPMKVGLLLNGTNWWTRQVVGIEEEPYRVVTIVVVLWLDWHLLVQRV